MIQTVVKRDGRIVGFNREKIAAAIRKAMLTTEAGEDEVLVYKIVDRIEFRGKEQSSVEEIQDMVEVELMERITGYLVGTTERWNKAKLAELNDRVVHK